MRVDEILVIASIEQMDVAIAIVEEVLVVASVQEIDIVTAEELS
jgi:hypothetical protein